MIKELENKIGQLQYEISLLGHSEEDLTGVTIRTDELKDLVKNLSIHIVSTRYLCECGWQGKHEEMKREFNFGYDQSCCPKCNDVLTNNLNWEVYCNVC